MEFSRQFESEQKEKAWKQILSDWRETGLSVVKYCDRNNISKHKFFYWKKKIEAPKQTLSIIPFDANGTSSNRKDSSINVTINNRYKVDVTGNFNPATFKQVVEVLRDL